MIEDDPDEEDEVEDDYDVIATSPMVLTDTRGETTIKSSGAPKKSPKGGKGGEGGEGQATVEQTGS